MMERLTTRDCNDTAYMVITGGSYRSDESSWQGKKFIKLLERLALYEDTGLDPLQLELIEIENAKLKNWIGRVKDCVTAADQFYGTEGYK